MAATSGRRCTSRKYKKSERPAVHPPALPLLVETPFYILLSPFGTMLFARYLSRSNHVAGMAVYMWRTIDWCYNSMPCLHSSPQ